MQPSWQERWKPNVALAGFWSSHGGVTRMSSAFSIRCGMGLLTCTADWFSRSMTLYPKAPAGAIEIRLNFDEVVVSENYEKLRFGKIAGKPTIAIDLKHRSAEVKFPSDLLRHFQQPKNTGERAVLRSITEGIISLYQETPRGY